MKNKLILSCMVAVLGAFSANAAPKFQNVHLIPGNEAIQGKVTLIKNTQRWTADTVYIIDRLTFVEAPAVLTIEPGTIVRMEQKTTGGTSVTDPADVGTLIICRGAKIVANGTAESPIIFTNIDDPFVPGGDITIPNFDNGVTNNTAYAPWSAGSFAKRSYAGNDRFNYDSTCGGVIILGRTPVAFGNPQQTTNGAVRFSTTSANAGSGYELSERTGTDAGTYRIDLSINNTGTGGAGADGRAFFDVTGGIKRVVVADGGNYSSSNAPTLVFSPTNDTTIKSLDSVVQPGYTVQMSETNGYWKVSSVTITNTGSGYAKANLAFSGANAVTNATGSAVVGRSLAQVVVRNPGSGYTNAPSLSINFTNSGSAFGAATVAPTVAATVTASIVTSPIADPTAIPSLTTGIGANFIEGFQTIDGTLLGTSQAVGGTTYNFSGSIYGGSDDEDNSGTLRFVSIRYGGFILSPNNEINGLTCGAVGRGTSFEFIEVVNNADDDIEHFGGSVDMKYVAGLFGGDDGIDLDQGYRGRIQFGFQIQNNTSGTSRPSANMGDCLGEWDGPENPTSGRPYTVHSLFNFTGIGTGNAASAGKGINYKDNSGGKVFNSIFADAKSGITLTEAGTATVADNAVSTGTTSGHRFATTRTNGGVENLLGVSGSAGEPDAIISHTSFRQIGTNGTTVADTLLGINTNATWGTNLINSNNFANNLSDFRGVARVATNGALDPRLATNSLIRSNGLVASNSGGVRTNDSFYTQTSLRGAFRDLNWLSGWSLLSEWGLLSDANCLIPAVRLTRTGGALFVGFDTEAGVEYAIETSNDGKKYTPYQTVLGTGSAANVSLGVNTANALKFVRVMPL